MYEKKYATLKLINKRLLIMQLHCGKTTDWDQHQVSHKTLMLYSSYIGNDFKLSFLNENNHIFAMQVITFSLFGLRWRKKDKNVVGAFLELLLE